MKKILETERLFLREFDISDAEKMWELNADPEVIKYTGDPPFQSIHSAENFLLAYDDYTKNGFGRWAIIEKTANEFIGWCGLKLNEEGHVDIGFRFFKRYWNKGYATEAANACLYYGFQKLNLNEIIARTDKANIPSVKVLKKLKMKFWKEDSCEGIHEAVYFRMTKADYLSYHFKNKY